MVGSKLQSNARDGLKKFNRDQLNMDGWYYKVFGSDFGPITFEELVELAKNQTLSSDDEVRFGENGQWRRAGSIGQLMAHFPFVAREKVITPSAPKPAMEEQAPVAPEEYVASEETEPPPSPAIVDIEKTVTPPQEVETRWWCQIQGKEYGPVDLPKLVEWASTGRLRRDDHVRFGVDPYVLAGELPGLFPELPTTGTKPEISTTSETRPMAVARPKTAEIPVVTKPSTNASITTPTAVANAPSPIEAPQPRPAASSGFGPSTSSPSRPAMPVRRPPVKSDSNGIVALLTGPIGMGVGGVIVLGALIYFALPYIPMGDSADVTRFKELQAAMADVAKLRKSDKVDESEAKSTASKIEKAAKKVAAELKGTKDPKSRKVLTFANKMVELAKEDLTKATDAEKTANSAMATAKRTLGVK